MDEFGKAQMGDARLTRRLIKLADRLGDAPSASIPGACNGHAETQGAYRLFDQARSDKRALGWEAVLTPHMARTEERMAAHPVVLCLQDTTELDFNGQQIDGLGCLSFDAQRGMYLHPTYAVTPQRLPLGILDNWMWARPLEGSESRRWVEGYERVAERAGHMPDTRLVYVADPRSRHAGVDANAPTHWVTRRTTCCAPSTTGACHKAASCGLQRLRLRPWARSNSLCLRGTGQARTPCSPGAACSRAGFARRPGWHDAGQQPDRPRSGRTAGQESHRMAPA